jgi:hypothetical protein
MARTIVYHHQAEHGAVHHPDLTFEAVEARELGVEKADVKARVVDDQFGPGDELRKFCGDVRKARLVD